MVQECQGPQRVSGEESSLSAAAGAHLDGAVHDAEEEGRGIEQRVVALGAGLRVRLGALAALGARVTHALVAEPQRRAAGMAATSQPKKPERRLQCSREGSLTRRG